MSTTRALVIASAKGYAQDAVATPLLSTESDYDLALAAALKAFDADVPNLRVIHYTVLAPAFRFVLSGVGAILTGLNAWVDGRSSIVKVWHPYDVTVQGQMPLDPNVWRVVREPTVVVLELLDRTPSSGVLRLETTNPHVVHADDPTLSSVLAGDVDPLNLLTGIKILELAAARAAQNTGVSGFPTDSVDRRTQSDVYASRARDLKKQYDAMVGKGGDVKAASALAELDVEATHAFGSLWHPKGAR